MDFLIDDDLTVDELVEIGTALQESFELIGDSDDEEGVRKEICDHDNII